MNAVIHPGLLRGGVRVPPSKSVAHRVLIAAALADAPTEIEISALNEDILATIGCLRALGAEIERTDAGLRVSPIQRTSCAESAGEDEIRVASDGESVCAESAGEDGLRVLNCGESGSTAAVHAARGGGAGRGLRVYRRRAASGKGRTGILSRRAQRARRMRGQGASADSTFGAADRRHVCRGRECELAVHHRASAGAAAVRGGQ